MSRVFDGESDTARSGPAAEWAALAHLIAGQPRVRLSKDGGRSYRTSNERALTPSLPTLPAAVRIMGADGRVAALCLDLDTSRGDVAADYSSLGASLDALGVEWVGDESPSGGRHVYVPFAPRIPFTDAREIVEALARRHPTIDPGPHQNAAAGCIRTPGSPHKRGGHQRLLTPLMRAATVLATGNPYSRFEGLRRSLRAEIAASAAPATEPLPLLLDSETAATADGRRSLPPVKAEIAKTGSFDRSMYSTPSEARQAVLASAAAAGWALTDVQAHMLKGLWPGMTGFYARYGAPAARTKALKTDWSKAVAYVAQQRRERAATADIQRNGRNCYTSASKTQGGGAMGIPDENVRDFLRTWRNALAVYEEGLAGTRSGLVARMLLRALGEAASKTGSRIVEFGVRSLAVATGVHHTTSARHLRDLARGEDGMIRLLQTAQGTRGDVYELVIPQRVDAEARARKWARGKVHAVRPVFRELGMVAAFAYEAIEQNDGTLNSAAVARRSKLSTTAANEALEALSAWNMIERRDGVWHVVGSTSLVDLAEMFGVIEDVLKQVVQYRRDRREWRQWLELRHSFGSAHLPDGDYPYWLFEPPPDAGATLLDTMDSLWHSAKATA